MLNSPKPHRVLPAYIEPIKGLRFIFDSPIYRVVKGTEDGAFLIKTRYPSSEAEEIWSSAAKVVRFRLINTLCQNEELKIFDSVNFNYYLKHHIEKVSGDMAHVFVIEWKGDYPFEDIEFTASDPWPVK